MAKGKDATVWAVLCGEETADGEVTDSVVRAVYDARDAALSHVEFVNEALEQDRQLPDLMYWVEPWDVRAAFDPDDELAL